METFFKILPPEYVESHNQQDGITVLKNGSTILWMHLDNVDENTLRGLELNAVLVDQAEEIEEKVFTMLKARIGRWDNAVVPRELTNAYKDWPRNELTGKFIAPSYIILLCNPDTQYHFIYRKFHPDSSERDSSAFWVEGEWDTKLGSSEAYDDALKNDPEWVEKYVRGKWGISPASIHYLPNSGLLDFSPDLLERIRTRGNLFRVMDHGDSAPTCCLWFAAIDGVFICYREYYVPGKVISYHRQAIFDLSRGEEYSGNFADPQIFKKTAQKDGGFWTVADEYKTDGIDAPPLRWTPADNNEFATRNRINELLKKSDGWSHPTSRERPAIGLYFIKKSTEYPDGCHQAYLQLGAQRREVLGTIDGKTIYSDERDPKVVDHAYDCVRYFISKHGGQLKPQRKLQRNTFAFFQKVQELRNCQSPAAGSIQ